MALKKFFYQHKKVLREKKKKKKNFDNRERRALYDIALLKILILLQPTKTKPFINPTVISTTSI